MQRSEQVYALSLRDLVLQVRLGCSAEERAHPQEVRLSVELRFAQEPQGATTDQLQDTICYGDLAEILTRHFTSQEFNLIERMGREAHALAREQVGPGVQVGIAIVKVRPPVENLLGGAVYRCGDFLP